MNNTIIDMDKAEIIERVKAAGIVGAGGGGFPTHVKLGLYADTVIANGAECEPLVKSDIYLLAREPEKVIKGLKAAMVATGALKGIIAIKAKNSGIISDIRKMIDKETGIELFLLDDFYPAGDEHVLVYEITKRIVPMGGIPPDVGVVVSNVFTLYAVAEALEGKNFTHRYVTVAGEVNSPGVAMVPIGMQIGEAIDEIAGGRTSKLCKMIIGGPMMGKIEENPANPILKTTNAIIVLPNDCRIIELKTTSLKASVKRSRSACCQCSFCTDLCPRYLLGHDLNPHEIIRVFPNADNYVNENYVYSASLCSECNLCGYYTCSMGLAPNIINSVLKNALKNKGIKHDYKKIKEQVVNKFREDRKVPVRRLLNRMGLSDYCFEIPFKEIKIKPSKLILLLKQHTGVPSVPVVRPGIRICEGDLVAAIPKDAFGANIHSPCSGIVKEVSDKIVIEVDNERSRNN